MRSANLAPPPDIPSPVACSLGAGDLRSQAQRWVELVRRAGLDQHATRDGVTLSFKADPRVERELRELVTIETACCAWARWELHVNGDHQLVMRAYASEDGVAVLQSMFRRVSGAAA